MYLDYAENQTKRRKAITMAEWEQKLDAFPSFNEKDLLGHADYQATERYAQQVDVSMGQASSLKERINGKRSQQTQKQLLN